MYVVTYKHGACLFFLLLSLILLIAGGPHHYHPACGHKESSHLSPVHALQFFITIQVRHSYNSSTKVEFYLLTFPRFPLRKKEHKSYFGKNRTHDFGIRRCACYLLDHSGQYSKSLLGSTTYSIFSYKPCTWDMDSK